MTLNITKKKPKPNPNVKVTLSAANVLYFTFISSWKKSWNYRWWALAKGYARQKLLQERPYVPVEIWVFSTSCRKYSELYRLLTALFSSMCQSYKYTNNSYVDTIKLLKINMWFKIGLTQIGHVGSDDILIKSDLLQKRNPIHCDSCFKKGLL